MLSPMRDHSAIRQIMRSPRRPVIQAPAANRTTPAASATISPRNPDFKYASPHNRSPLMTNCNSRADRPRAANLAVAAARWVCGRFDPIPNRNGSCLPRPYASAVWFRHASQGQMRAGSRTNKSPCCGRRSSRSASRKRRSASTFSILIFGLYIGNRSFERRGVVGLLRLGSMRAGAAGAGAFVAQILDRIFAAMAVPPVDLDALGFGDGDVFRLGLRTVRTGLMRDSLSRYRARRGCGAAR